MEREIEGTEQKGGCSGKVADLQFKFSKKFSRMNNTPQAGKRPILKEIFSCYFCKLAQCVWALVHIMVNMMYTWQKCHLCGLMRSHVTCAPVLGILDEFVSLQTMLHPNVVQFANVVQLHPHFIYTHSQTYVPTQNFPMQVSLQFI